MRLQSSLFLASLPAAGLLAGCAMGPQGTTATVAPQATRMTISGKIFGGQQAVSSAVIAVYTYGSTGYGSTGTQLAVTATDADGNFTTDYACPASAPNAPVYVLSIGGQPSPTVVNDVLVEGAAVGACSSSEASYVTISEISTVALAYSLSHFFNVGTKDSVTSDHFGGPASLTAAISRTNNDLIPTILSVENGYPAPSTATFTNEAAKMITIADILGSCVNSVGAASPSCMALFQYATPPNGIPPVDTLQAAVNIALNPTRNVAQLYSLVPPSGSSAYAGSLPSQPNDWTLAVSYTNPSAGLALDAHAVSTLDIDASGRVWYPSNLPSSAGVAYFDPSAGTFSPVFTAPGIVRPQQVAIDVNGTVWIDDLYSSNVAGFPGSSPQSPTVLNLPGYTTTALTVDDDNSLRFAAYNSSINEPVVAEVTNTNNTYSYTTIPNTTPTGAQGYIGASLAGDLVGGTGISASDIFQPNMYEVYLYPNNGEEGVLFQGFVDSGQVAFSGTDFVTARGGYQPSDDGICVFSTRSCFGMANQALLLHPSGLAVDGGGNLWLSDSYGGTAQQIPFTNGTYLNGNSQAMNQVYMHGTNNGGTMGSLAGIAVDATGNVWVSNAGCSVSGCTPGPFVLTEVLGAGVPTINPVSAQVVLNSAPGTEPSLTHLAKPTR